MKKIKIRGWKHFFNTIATSTLGYEVLKKVETSEVEHGHIVVYYSDEGMCIFKVVKENLKVRVVEFISTAC